MTKWNSQQINQIFHSFSGLFIGAIQIEDDIAAPELLARGQLDFSLESLAEVDKYLALVFADRDSFSAKEHENTVL